MRKKAKLRPDFTALFVHPANTKMGVKKKEDEIRNEAWPRRRNFQSDFDQAQEGINEEIATFWRQKSS